MGQRRPADLDPAGRLPLPRPGHPGPAAERHYRAAPEVEGAGKLAWELARTEWLYGEWLRRTRRRADTRRRPWAERARAELRASGQTARRRDPSTLTQLTPQELEIVRLVGRGLSNRGIAERLFMSRHTVGYQLHKIYAKLGISSRTELSQLDLGDDDSG